MYIEGTLEQATSRNCGQKEQQRHSVRGQWRALPELQLCIAGAETFSQRTRLDGYGDRSYAHPNQYSET
jgi:hypothetical protein